MEHALIDELAAARELALDTSGKSAAGSGAVALSKSGARYAAGSVASQTHLLDIPAELAALVRAVHAGDREITEVMALTSDPHATPSPLVLKILADHAARTGTPIKYRLYAESGAELFAAAEAASALGPYRSMLAPLTPLSEALSAPSATLERAESLESQLQRYALAGASRNFPTKDGSTGYGAAILAGDAIYYGGQYSASDHRLGVHAEMAVLVEVLMSGAQQVTAIGIASPKFRTTPVSPCGACRQFIHEVCTLRGWSPAIWCFATEGSSRKSTLAELLPLQWSNKV